MSETRDVALVLRQKGRLLSVLSIKHGRTEQLFFNTKRYEQYLVGSLVSYSVQSLARNKHLVIEALTVEKQPYLATPSCLYLLHALIEICYYFIPLGVPAYKIIHHFLEIIFCLEQFNSHYYQKYIICFVFALLGIYPEDVLSLDDVEKIIAIPVDKLKDKEIELTSEELLNTWLEWCLASFPQGKWCKALPFLLKSPVI